MSSTASKEQQMSNVNINKEEQMSDADISKELEEIQALFVQTAPSVEKSDGRMVLRNVSHSTLYFSDRPQRVVGHIGTPQFVDIWDDGENSFAEDPPNAVLAFLGQGDSEPEDVVIEITDPILKGSDLSYAVTVLEGTVPERAGACSLFIDPLGRPLSPMSVAGVNRRDRRRDRR
jgi:hypothetical protein